MTTTNVYNGILETRRAALQLAQRSLLAPGCQPAAQPAADAPSRPDRAVMRHRPFSVPAPAAADAVILPPVSRRRYVHEFIATHQAGGLQIFTVWHGPRADGFKLFEHVNTGANTTVIVLPFSGREDEFHFAIDAGRAMIIGGPGVGPLEGLVSFRYEHQDGGKQE